MERVLTNVIKGLMYSVMMGVLGVFVALILKWPILKGVYVMILGLGVLSLSIAVLFFVGTPKSRFEFFTGIKYKKGEVNPSLERIPDEEKQSIDKQAGSPAIIGVVMILIGFFIEALMH